MSSMFRSIEGVAYQRGSCGIPMIAETERDPSYRCVMCGEDVPERCVEALTQALQTCGRKACDLQRIQELKAAEVDAIASGEVLKRIAAVVVPDLRSDAETDLKTTYSRLLMAVCAAAHEICNAEGRRVR